MDVHLSHLKMTKQELHFQQGLCHVNQVSVVNINFLVNVYLRNRKTVVDPPTSFLLLNKHSLQYFFRSILCVFRNTGWN